MKRVYDTTTIGGRLKALRREAGYSQEELASLLVVKQNTLSKYENNEHDIPIDVLANAARILNTTPTYLVWGDSDDSEWLAELNEIGLKITDPKLREVVIRQLKVLTELN